MEALRVYEEVTNCLLLQQWQVVRVFVCAYIRDFCVHTSPQIRFSMRTLGPAVGMVGPAVCMIGFSIGMLDPQVCMVGPAVCVIGFSWLFNLYAWPRSLYGWPRNLYDWVFWAKLR